MNNDLIFKLWVESQRSKIAEWRRSKSKKKFVGERGYLHFDGKILFKHHIDTNNHAICNTLRDVKNIESHKFLPFIRDDIRVKQYRNKGPLDAKGFIRKHSDRYSTIKNRPIMYAAHRDACIYSMYGYVLNEAYEKELIKNQLISNVLAYRKIQRPNSARNKSNIDFAKDYFDHLSEQEETGLIMIDVSHFFDSINHIKLSAKWAHLLETGILPPDHASVFKSLTRFRYVFKRDVLSALNLSIAKLNLLSRKQNGSLCSPKDFNNKIKKNKLIRVNKSGAGIPQGSPISGLLANIYMMDFDKRMKQYVEVENGGYYGRYSDDIMIMLEKDKLKAAYEFAQTTIQEEGLEIKDKKTECFVFDRNSATYSNGLKLIGIDPDFNHKEYPQYLGFSFGSKEMIVRSSTLVRRFRGSNKLWKNRWQYFGLSRVKTGSVKMSKQIIRLRIKVKKAVNSPIVGKNTRPKNFVIRVKGGAIKKKRRR